MCSLSTGREAGASEAGTAEAAAAGPGADGVGAGRGGGCTGAWWPKRRLPSADARACTVAKRVSGERADSWADGAPAAGPGMRGGATAARAAGVAVAAVAGRGPTGFPKMSNCLSPPAAGTNCGQVGPGGEQRSPSRLRANSRLEVLLAPAVEPRQSTMGSVSCRSGCTLATCAARPSLETVEGAGEAVKAGSRFQSATHLPHELRCDAAWTLERQAALAKVPCL